MGKKIKKDDKNTAEDTFDPLLVESKQAETVVLMLTSPEEEVQMKACQAIYKFISKCEENKDVLHKLDVCSKLIILLRSEDKTVRRDSVMAIGVMTESEAVRKALNKEGKIVGILIRLLSNEEYPTTNEFAATALSNLCQEYTSIAQLIELNGIPSLVECLGHEDPDVQKNAVICLDLVLRDFEARPLLKSCEGLVALVELLKSEYPIIQETALKAISKAVLDSTIRAIFRDLESIGKFVDIIGQPEFNDLHCISLQVISTCLEDIECVKQMKESGGLVRLISFIGDAQPPEDDSKEKPKKTSKSGSAKKKKKEDDDKPKESVASFTLPEVKVQACKAIMRASNLDDVRKLFHEVEVERLLVALLSHESEAVRTAAAQALGVMAQSAVSQSFILELGGIEQLVRLLRSDHKELRESVSLALANITTGNLRASQEIASKHGLEHLINSITFSHEGIASNGLVAVSNMSTDEPLRTKLIQHGIVKALVTALKSQSIQVQTKACLATAGFLTDDKARNDFRNFEGIPPLTALLNSPSSDVRRSACWAITIVGVDKDCAEALAQEGAISKLQEINNSEIKRNKFSEVALNKLYDNNLNLKYAVVGYLDFTDQIGELFFDCGAHRQGSQLESLEDYCQQPVNNKRPIILINTTVQRPPTATTSVITETDDKKASDDKQQSKKRGPKTRSNSKTKKEKGDMADISEDPGKYDGEESIVLVKPIPTDLILVQKISDVEDLISSMETVEEKLEALAKYVCDSMGGPIPKDQIMAFPYELEMSKLKVEFGSNVIPIGSITSGIHVHRALLFKFLADRLFLATNLNRGDYNRSWNEVWIINKHQKPSKFNPKLCIIDLIHQPGRFISKDSPEGNEYRRL